MNSYRQPIWECAHFEDTIAAADIESLRSSGFVVAEIDGASVSDKETLLGSLAEALNFPDYFGRNWDALDECLRDLGEWLPAKGYLLIVRNAEALWQREPKHAASLLQSWTFSAEEWAKQDVPFHLVFVW